MDGDREPALVGDLPPAPGEPIDDTPPELAAPEEFLQVSAGLLAVLAPLAGLPRSGPGPDPAAEARLLAEARQRLLVPASGPPVLTPGMARLVRSVAAPELVLVAVARTLGAELGLQIRVGPLSVLVDVLPDTGDLWCTARPGLDVAAYACTLLDLLDRPEPEPVEPAGWTGAPDDLVAMRTLGHPADDAAVADLCTRTGASADLVRAAAAPVALAHVEVVHRSDPAAAGGPSAVRAGELVWFDGGPHGIWLVEPRVTDPDGVVGTVDVSRRTPAGLAAELTALVHGTGAAGGDR